MKITSLTLFLLLSGVTLSAKMNWIPIEPTNKQQSLQSNSKLDVNLSKIQPINTMIQRITAIKQLVDVTRKEIKPTTNNKNWFVLNAGNSD